jgi:hypothetical protein
VAKRAAPKPPATPVPDTSWAMAEPAAPSYGHTDQTPGSGEDGT